MEEKNQDNNKPVENQHNENEHPKPTSQWKDILWSITGVIITVFLIFFTIRGVKATIHSHRERKKEQRKEACVQQQSVWSVDWNDYEHLIPAPESLESFLSYYDDDAFSLEALDQLLAGPMAIKRPCNIVLDGDPDAFARRYITPLQVPVNLDTRTAEEFVDFLMHDELLSSEFWEWINDCIQFNNHIAHINCDPWEKPQEYNAIIGRIVTHLHEYLSSDGLHYDKIFKEKCDANDLWDWFESQNKIVEIDSSYYRAINIVENPYRQFEVFVYRLVEEFDVPADSISQWLESCPLWIDDDDDIPFYGETVLPPPPALIRDTIFNFEGDTIWLSDIAAEWVMELKHAATDGVEDWLYLTNYYIGLENVINDYFSHYYYYDNDDEIATNPIVSKIREGIMQPDIFEALVAWMSPTVIETLQQFDATERQAISEGIEYLMAYLHNGDYERDLEYEKLKGPVSQGFAIEYAPDDFIIIDGEIYEGTKYKPYRKNEVRLFVALQYGVNKNRVEQLLKEVLEIVNNKTNIQ